MDPVQETGSRLRPWGLRLGALSLLDDSVYSEVLL